ncbi:hypothetical protein MMC29_003274 [Sticta canariensis]|nr:hypothetical protein [Sticta canariensis]
MNSGSQTSGRSVVDNVKRSKESAKAGGSGNGGKAGPKAGPSPETGKGEVGSVRLDPPDQSLPQLSSPSRISRYPDRYPEHPFQGGQMSGPPPRSTKRPSPPTIRTQGLNTPSRQHPQVQGNPHERQTTGPAQELPRGRGPPPQRPPRPTYVPPIYPSDPPGDRFRQLQSQSQTPQQQNQLRVYREDGLQSYPHQEPSSNPARSPTSPLATMPEFPLPAVASLNLQQPRRTANLGPPPSARKGAPSYYTQNSYVAPIPEEMSDAHASFASSHVIARNWADGTLYPYHGEGFYREDLNPRTPNIDDPGSRSGDQDESTQLVKPPGSGKRKRKKKMVQTTDLGRTKSGKPTAGAAINDSPSDNRLYPKILTPGARASGATIEMGSKPPGDRNGRNDAVTTLVPPSPGNSPFPSPTSPLPELPQKPPHPGSQSSVDPRVHEILGNIEKGTTISSSGEVSPLTAGSFVSERIPKRPPPLNLSLTKEGERASQTSLPELIRRATRLAANLDRTRASKAGLVDAWGGSTKSSRAGSISDMLAAFPSPSLATPPSVRWPPSSMTKSSTTKGQVPPPPDSTNEGAPSKSKVRKCCGMPVWVFVLLLALLVLLVAAAVVIPVTLIVLPRTRHRIVSVESCEEKGLCGNGGTNVVVDNSCSCVCANGFTGATCVNPPDESCTFTDIKIGRARTVYQNATVGSGLPRLFSDASHNFSILLDSTILLSRFSATNLTCTEENVLVTFGGTSQRRSLPMQLVMPNVDLVEKPRATSAQRLIPTIAPQRLALREDIAGTGSSDVATSNGILFATSTLVQEPSPTSTIAKPSSGPSSDGIPSNGIPDRAFDFARVAVLLVFQETSLNIAVAANQRLRVALENPKTWNLSAVFATDSILVDLAKFTVTLANGTTVGRNV